MGIPLGYEPNIGDAASYVKYIAFDDRVKGEAGSRSGAPVLAHA